MKKVPQTRLTKFAFSVMWWMGSTASLIVHTIIFILAFIVVVLGVSWTTVLLVVTTVVSLEAIYMNILIQMGVNQNTESLREVEGDIDEIQVDVDEIQKDVDVIQEDVDEIQKDVDVIQVDVDEIEKGIDEIQEDVDEREKEDKAEVKRETENGIILNKIELQLQDIIKEIENIRSKGD